jgi:hypothetical protein
LTNVFLRERSPFIHGPDLGYGNVAFIHENKKIFGEVIQQRRRRLAGQSAGQVPE